ncbi:MAG: glycosyltransferase [Bdellovibrionales bacterium]|nr:glycosyltransferase [Bdellovibrionales bacterium]
MGASRSLVVQIVTFNNESTIHSCLTSALELEAPEGFEVRISVLDNASSDSTSEVLAGFEDRIELIRELSNLGFTGGHNELTRRSMTSGAAYVLLLNPDVRLEADALTKLVDALENDSRAGAACPQLFRADSALEPITPLTLDAAGMFITPAIRHFDRGSEEVECGKYNAAEYVFGGSGAALLLRASFVDDVSLRLADRAPELFDDSFFAYREDADLAWRAQWLGWKCRYVPDAHGYHVRKVLPERRAALSPVLNALGVNKKFLIQLNNFSFTAQWQCLPWSLLRNAAVVIACCTIERTSLNALLRLPKYFPRARLIRRWLTTKRRMGGSAVARWFQFSPRSEPALVKYPARRLRTVTAIIVNYNSGPRVAACVEALRDAKRELTGSLGLDLVVVDNASTDDSCRTLQQRVSLSDFRLEALRENLGFGGAINHAARLFPADAFLVLNPDVVITADAIVHLADALNDYSLLGLVSPVLVSNDGCVQHGFSVRRFPTLGATLAELFFLHRLWPSNPWTSSYGYADDPLLRAYLDRDAVSDAAPHEDGAAPVLVEQPAGACLLLRAEAFRAAQGFDERYWPAWFEDVDLAKRLFAKRIYAGIVAQARAVHEGGYSVSALPDGRFAEIWYGNLRRFWTAHGTKAERFILRAALPVALGCRALVFGVLGVFSSTERARLFAVSRQLAGLALTTFSDA